MDDLLKITADAARTFTETYYHTASNNRPEILAYYAPNSSIVWNGNPIAGPQALLQVLANTPAATYEVQCYDAQPMNPDGRGSCGFMLMVSGHVKYGGEKGESRGFSDTFVLKPDETDNKRFLIMSQGFRLVV